MRLISDAIFVLLGVQSILGLGLFVEALVRTVILPRNDHQPLLDLQRLLLNLSGNTSDNRRRLQFMSRDLPEKVAAAVRQLTQPKASVEAADIHIGHWLETIEGGSQRLCSWLIPTAPMVGLAGTLAGISEALSHFQQRSESPELMIAGFAVAIQTTLIGLWISFLCWITIKLLWTPYLGRIESSWETCFCLIQERCMPTPRSGELTRSVRATAARKSSELFVADAAGTATVTATPVCPSSPAPRVTTASQPLAACYLG